MPHDWRAEGKPGESERENMNERLAMLALWVYLFFFKKKDSDVSDSLFFPLHPRLEIYSITTLGLIDDTKQETTGDN